MEGLYLNQMSNKDLQEYYNRFIELERYKLAERVKKEIDRRAKNE